MIVVETVVIVTEGMIFAASSATLYPIYHLVNLVDPTTEELHLLLPAVTEELFVLSLLSRGQNIDSKDKDPQLQKWLSLIISNT